MRLLKSLFSIIFASGLFISCSTHTAVVHPTQNSTATTNKESVITASFTPSPATKELPSQAPTTILASTQQLDNESGMIALFGDESHAWHSLLAFSPTAPILAQVNASVKLWDINTHQLIREIKFPYTGEATNILFSPDGNLLAVNISDEISTGVASNSHLLVWDVVTGKLQQDWIQGYAIMYAYDGYQTEPRTYKISVNAMVFFPASTKLAYANGNRIEIKDVRTGEELNSWSLGETMYASELSTREDGEFLYVFMKWYKNLTFPALYRWKFKAQIWHPSTKRLRQEIKFEEVDPLLANMWIVDQYLIHEDTMNSTLDVLDLSTNKRKDFPYRIGWKYFNSDASLMAVSRYVGGPPDSKQGIEVWDTDSWKNIYTFKPSFIDNGYFLSDIVFSPDKSLLALDTDGQISLWDLNSQQQSP